MRRDWKLRKQIWQCLRVDCQESVQCKRYFEVVGSTDDDLQQAVKVLVMMKCSEADIRKVISSNGRFKNLPLSGLSFSFWSGVIAQTLNEWHVKSLVPDWPVSMNYPSDGSMKHRSWLILILNSSICRYVI
jgi:hypothetical protein